MFELSVLNSFKTVGSFILYKDTLAFMIGPDNTDQKLGITRLGGHIELNELPEEACIREAQEESGLKISLYNPLNKQLKNSCELVGEKLLINPMYTILGEINPEHYHIDFVYYATANSFDTIPGDGESNLLKWYSKEALKNVYDIQNNILTMANEAVDLLVER